MAATDLKENGKKKSVFTKKNIIITISLVAILILVIVSVRVSLGNIAEEFEGEKITKAKTVLGQLSVIPIQKSDTEKLKGYNEDFNKNTDWKDNELILSNLCDFATLLLKYYNEKPDDTESKEYLKFANNVIKKIDSKIFKPKNYSIIAKSRNYSLFCSLTRLLNTFEYFADDSYRDTKIICHNQILHMIPDFNKLHLDGVTDSNIGGYLKGCESIYTITARLLTNAISNRDLYNVDVKNRGVIKVLKEQFAVLSNDAEKKNNFNLYPYYYNMYEIFSSGQS
ncbi:GSCOCT00005229001.2-RA-CDS [Cotesia congregata]|uniref:Cc_odve66_2 n=1 Tax=Cotesia congregata TaxID=51543 RepID=B9W493_COTCN|nr:GSCOCT00005229001.2-RA-CDS [Cotesia congregata]CAG5101840.1 Cc_odve66_2 [Cotesia congregata]CAR31581.1 putative envelope protein ODV-E66-2 [Cotesia congregata]